MSVSISLQFQPYSAEPLFAEAMPIDSVSFDGVQSLSIGSQSTGAGAGKATFSPVTITRRYDARSPAFWSRMCSGTPFQKARLTFTHDADKTPFLTVGYSLLAIKTIHVDAGVAGSVDVNEVVSFEDGAVTFTQVTQTPDGTAGSVTTGWDRVRNVALNTPIVLGA